MHSQAAPTVSVIAQTTTSRVMTDKAASAPAGADAALSVMTREVVVCAITDTVGAAWECMKQRKLKNIPVVEAESRPVGVLHARDLLQVLLEDAEDEKSMLRDYVMGVGYR